MNGLWQRAADRLRDELGQVGFETWIGPLNFVGVQGRTVTVEAPNRFFRDWVNDRYLALLLNALHTGSVGPIPGPPPTWEEIRQRYDTERA